MASYVLATAFEEVWLQPGGNIGILGVGVEATFLRGALDRLGIEPELEQRHEYKNAADIFMRTEFTLPTASRWPVWPSRSSPRPLRTSPPAEGWNPTRFAG